MPGGCTVRGADGFGRVWEAAGGQVLRSNVLKRKKPLY